MRLKPGHSKIALLSAALLLAACDELGEADRLSQACGDDAHAAYDMTKRFVAGNLGKQAKSTTIEFPDVSEVRTRKSDPDNPCGWLIYGYVDLKSKSGAVEQRQYIVNIAYSGDNSWRATDFRWQSLGDNQKAAKGD